jgi:hypothetical protein
MFQINKQVVNNMYLALDNSFYVVTLIIIALCFIYILIFYTIIPLTKNSKAKKQLISYLSGTNYGISKDKKVEADFILKVNEVKYLVKIVDVKKNCDVNISVNKTLVMYYNTITNALKSKENVEVESFIKNDNKNKILLLNAKVNKISYSKNEAEVIELQANEMVNNTKIINYNNFEIIKK